MNKANGNSPGYILVLTLLILSIIIVLVTQLVQRATVHVSFDHTMIEREKAKELALSGIQIAMSQLAVQPKEKKEEKTVAPKTAGADAKDAGAQSAKQSPDEQNKQLLQAVLPALNQWQEYALKEDVDGIDGAIKICIMSEDGKININELYDFAQSRFVDEKSPQAQTKKDGQEDGTDKQAQESALKKAMKTVFENLKKATKGNNLFEIFEKFLKTRQYRLNDVTELLEITEFKTIFKDRIFYEPQRGDAQKRALYLTDIFTVWSDSATVNPWLLSDSVAQIIGVTPSQSGDIQGRERLVSDVMKNNKSLSQKLDTLWDASLAQLYSKKEYKSLSKEIIVLLGGFQAETFSVVSHGTVGNITQRVFAIITKQDPATFLVKKIYWI